MFGGKISANHQIYQNHSKSLVNIKHDHHNWYICSYATLIHQYLILFSLAVVWLYHSCKQVKCLEMGLQNLPKRNASLIWRWVKKTPDLRGTSPRFTNREGYAMIIYDRESLLMSALSICNTPIPCRFIPYIAIHRISQLACGHLPKSHLEPVWANFPWQHEFPKSSFGVQACWEILSLFPLLEASRERQDHDQHDIVSFILTHSQRSW